MFKPILTSYCPACNARVVVHATQHTDGLGTITTTQTTEHDCETLAAALQRGDDSIVRTILLSAQ